MNILLGCLSYKEYTGSEIYFYELSTALIDAGHTVSIFCLTKGAPLISKTKNIFFVPSLLFQEEDKVESVKYDLVIFSNSKVIWSHLKNINTKKFIN